MYRYIICFTFLSVVYLNRVDAQAIVDDPGVDAALKLTETWLDAQRDYEEIPGFSVGVVSDQDLIWSRGFGYSNLENKTPATPQTKYSICSISKLFTSIAFMQLRDKGLVRLDDSPGKHLPWFSIEQAHPDGPAVTLEGLLTHSSGLPRESDFPYWNGPTFDFPSRDDVRQRLSDQKTLYPASTYFQYSNLGLTLVGEIVAAVSGQSYERYVQEHILDSMELNDTMTMLPEKEWGEQLAKGYTAMTRNGTRDPLPLFQAEGITPAAGFSSTVEDLARFASWQFRTLSGENTGILDSNTLKEMHRVHWLDPDWKTSWGLGFNQFRANNKTFVGHGGSCPGYTTRLIVEPRSKIAIVFMTNASGVDVTKYALKVFDIVEPAIKAAQKSTGEPKPLDAALDKFVGTYSSQPWGGESAIVHRKGSLAVFSLPTTDPLAGIRQLKHVDGNTFRAVREDGELGEAFMFQEDHLGRVFSYHRNSNFWPRVR